MTRALSLNAAVAGLLFLGGCSAANAAALERPSVYRCADGRFFTVDRKKGSAEVNYYGQHFRLQRRSSAIGTRYSSSEATLIVDSGMAAFATERILDLQVCRLMRPDPAAALHSRRGALEE